MNEHAISRLAGWFLAVAVAYVLIHLALYASDQTPDEFMASLGGWLQSIGRSLMPDLGGAITGR